MFHFSKNSIRRQIRRQNSVGKNKKRRKMGVCGDFFVEYNTLRYFFAFFDKTKKRWYTNGLTAYHLFSSLKMIFSTFRPAAALPPAAAPAGLQSLPA